MNLDLASLVFLALFGGLLSIASPCGGLLIPIFFAHTFKTKEKYFINSLLFFIGSYIASFLVALGVYYIFVSFPYANYLFKVMGVFFIIIGVMSLFGKSITLPTPKLKDFNNSKFTSSFLLGIFAAFSHGSCCGPVLGLIATNIARFHNIFIAAFVMLFYTIGITLPFILIAFGLDKIALLKRIFVKGYVLNLNLFDKTISIHSSHVISFIFFTFSGIVLLFFNGSLMSILSFSKLDFNFMLQYQDSLINFIVTK